MSGHLDTSPDARMSRAQRRGKQAFAVIDAAAELSQLAAQFNARDLIQVAHSMPDHPLAAALFALVEAGLALETDGVGR